MPAFFRTGQSMRYVEQHIARTAARPLTERQSRVLAFARAQVAAGRPFPSEPEIQVRFGWKYSRAPEDVLSSLEARGLVERVERCWVGRRIHWCWRLTAEGEARDV